MKTYLSLLILLFAQKGIAQPVWSPEVRADRENKWMHDSLHLTGKQLKKAYDISLDYYRQLDKYEGNDSMRAKVMHQKDATFKPMLSSKQYQRYYNREMLHRRALKIKYEGKHQPY